MHEHQHLHITGVDIRFTGDPSGNRIRPVIHGGTVQLTSEGFTTLMQEALSTEIVLPFVTLNYVDSRLIEGGAEVTISARTPLIQRNVRARVSLSLSELGALRVRILDVRAGLLPVTWLLEPLLSYVDRQPGLSQSGSRCIDVNIPALLHARGIPVDLAASLRWVSASPDAIVIEFG